MTSTPTSIRTLIRASTCASIGVNATRIFGIAAAASLVIACASCAGSSSAPADPRPRAVPARPDEIRYTVDVAPAAAEVRVEARLPASDALDLVVDRDAQPFLRDVVIERAGALEPVQRGARGFHIPACAPGGCSLRYRFLLADAAGAIDDFGIASEHRGAMLAPPSSWLLRPVDAPDEQPFRFHVNAPSDISFVTGVFPAKDGEPDTYAAALGDLPDAPFSAFGPVRRSIIRVPGGEVELAILPGELGEPDSVVLEWVASAAENVARYYGQFPVPKALVMILPIDEGGVGYAKTLGNGGASIVAPVGRDAQKSDFDADWVMTHEMVHLAFPNVQRRHSWIEEGLATYIEPIARARLGKISDEEMWRDLARGLPKGLPEPGDRGLDYTPTWGRTYWGGALFCLLADIEIRERTQNRRSIDDALRAIVRAGGTVAERWSLEATLDTGDRATGVPVLRELHAVMGSTPHPVDIPDLMHRLGVHASWRRVRFDDDAPLAAIRRSITSPSPAADSKAIALPSTDTKTSAASLIDSKAIALPSTDTKATTSPSTDSKAIASPSAAP